MRRFLASLALLSLVGCAGGDEQPDDLPPLPTGKADDYGPTGVRCDGFPRVAVDTAEGYCVGLVAGSDDRLFKPRVLLELPDRPRELLVTDLGGWRVGQGRIWYLDARDPARTELRVALEGLSLPHQMILGPDGWIHVGLDTHVFAFPPDAVGADGVIDPSRIDIVLDGLPPMDRDGQRNSFHPLTNFVFDEDGHLYVNVGAYSDHCADFVGRECHETDGPLDVAGAGSADPRDWGAVIRRYERIGERRYDPVYRVVAHGLRNSMGLAFAPNGDLLQVENGRDFRESDRPFEELNVIERAVLVGDAPARHYGWPYCYDAYETSDEWAGYEGFRCTPDNPRYQPPHVLLPPHGAPLGLAYYHGPLFEELEGRLLVPLHGYRAPGHRLLAFDVDPNGLPIRVEGATYLENPTGEGGSVVRDYPASPEGPFAAQGTYLISAWFEVAGVRPKGAPVAPYVSSDGSIWIADDKNRSILRIARAQGALPPVQRVDTYPAYRRALNEDPELRALYDAMVASVLRSPQCQGCHDDFRLVGDESQYPELRYLLALGNWIRPGQPDESILYTKLLPVGGASMPPSGREWPSQAEGEAAVATIEAFVRALPELSPAFNEGWIGGPCTVDADCDYDGGFCAAGGSCSLACSAERPFCPDRTGNATTFCVDLGGGEAGCVAQCDASAPVCLDGQTCAPALRFGRDDERTVCR